MKYLCILFLLLTSDLAQSQNWEIAVPGDHYYFKQKIRSSQEPIKGPEGFTLDSAILQQGVIVGHSLTKVLAFNMNNPNCDTLIYSHFGKETLINSSFQKFVFSNGIQFIFPRFFSSSQAHFIINSDSAGNKLRATYLFHDTLTYDGQLDSVVVYKVRHIDSLNQVIQLGYNDTLIISKNHGILRMLDWAGFPSSYGTVWEQNENLPLTKREIFDYQPGDEFHIRTRNISPAGPPSYSNYKILARIDSGLTNSIKYVRELRSESFTINWNVNPPQRISHYYHSIDTITYNNLDELYGGIPFQIEPNSSYYSFSHSGRANYGIPAYLVQPPPFDTNNCWANHNGVFGTLEQEIIKGIGILKYYNANGQGGPSTIEHLEYYKKGNKTWGTPRIITGLSKEEKAVEFAIYPNPSSGMVYLQNTSTNAIQLRVYDLQGRLIREAKIINKSQVDLSDLPNGIYQIQVNSGVQTYSEKLIIQKH